MTRFAGDAFLAGDMFSPDYDEMSGAGMKGDSMKRQTAMDSERMMAGANIEADSMLDIAKSQASAIRASGQAQGQASMASGIGGMISGIADGFGSMGTTASAAPASSIATPKVGHGFMSSGFML